MSPSALDGSDNWWHCFLTREKEPGEASLIIAHKEALQPVCSEASASRTGPDRLHDFILLLLGLNHQILLETNKFEVIKSKPVRPIKFPLHSDWSIL